MPSDRKMPTIYVRLLKMPRIKRAAIKVSVVASIRAKSNGVRYGCCQPEHLIPLDIAVNRVYPSKGPQINRQSQPSRPSPTYAQPRRPTRQWPRRSRVAGRLMKLPASGFTDEQRRAVSPCFGRRADGLGISLDRSLAATLAPRSAHLG